VRKDSVQVRLAGGIGNQLFQLLAAFMIARQKEISLNVELFGDSLNAYAIARPPLVNHRTTLANVIFSPSDIPPPGITQLFLRVLERIGLNSLHFLLMRKTNVVAGYCQHPPDINTSSDLITEFRIVVQEHLKKRFHDYLPHQPIKCLVHIRGGDALLPENAKRYSLPVEYYKNAFELITRPATVFSDDKEYALSVLESSSAIDAEYIDSFAGEQYIAYAIDANSVVLSRSTLSFWAGFLSNARMIYLPKSYPIEWAQMLVLGGKSVIRLDH
jgi:hypothetical protein